MKIVPKSSMISKLEIFKNGGRIPKYQNAGVLNNLGVIKDSYISANGELNKSKEQNDEYIPSDSIKDYIKSVEKYKRNWYKDGKGFWTIGYGFKEKSHPQLRTKYPNEMTEAQASAYFDKVIEDSLERFKQLTPNFDKLNQNQRDALLSYYYNVGEGTYSTKSPNMQQALREQNWEEVAKQMDAGYNDSKNPGLRDRRDYERTLFLTPVEKPYDFVEDWYNRFTSPIISPNYFSIDYVNTIENKKTF